MHSSYFRILTCVLVAGLFPLTGPVASLAQIVTNGSFEEEGQFSVEGWQFTGGCEGEAHEDAPGDGGRWSLELPMRNVQGGCYSYAYQPIQEVEDGDVWHLTAWARQPPQRGGATRIYWTTFSDSLRPAPEPGYLSSGPIDSTSSSSWVKLSVTDTLRLAEGDSVAIVLDADWKGGYTEPEADRSFFDLVRAEKIGKLSNEDMERSSSHIRLETHPNPVRQRTTITYVLPRAMRASLSVYDALGREVRQLVHAPKAAGTHHVRFDASGLPAGVYVYRLQAGKHSETKRMTLVK